MPPTKESLAPWSISKGQVAYNCNLQFRLKYIERAKKQHIESSAGRIGAAAHEFIEQYMKGDAYELAYRKAVINNKLTRKETLTLATYKDAVLSFVERFTKWRETLGVSDEDYFIEKDVSFDKDCNPVGYWDKSSFFRGKWDIGALVRRAGKLYVVIIDHKTGAPKEDLERYKDQLWSYMASALIMYPDLAGAQSAIHWMQADDPSKAIVWGSMINREQIEDEILPWFWEYFDAAGKKGLDTPVPEKGWYCDFCEYRYRCPLFSK